MLHIVLCDFFKTVYFSGNTYIQNLTDFLRSTNENEVPCAIYSYTGPGRHRIFRSQGDVSDEDVLQNQRNMSEKL